MTNACLIDEERLFPPTWGVKSLLSESKWKAGTQQSSPGTFGEDTLIANESTRGIDERSGWLIPPPGSTVIHQIHQVLSVRAFALCYAESENKPLALAINHRSDLLILFENDNIVESEGAEFGRLFIWFMYSFRRDSLALFGDTKSQSLEKQSACQAISAKASQFAAH